MSTLSQGQSPFQLGMASVRSYLCNVLESYYQLNVIHKAGKPFPHFLIHITNENMKRFWNQGKAEETECISQIDTLLSNI